MVDIPKLPFHEKLSVSVILSGVGVLLFLNWMLREPEVGNCTSSRNASVPLLVEVTIKGAVQEPGVVQIHRGATVEEALAFVKPLSTANLRRISLSSKILHRRTITIPGNEALKRRPRGPASKGIEKKNGDIEKKGCGK